MRIQLKKVFLISQIFIFLACNSKIDPKITISKVNGSPSYENSKITSVEQKIVDNEYEFTFEICTLCSKLLFLPSYTPFHKYLYITIKNGIIEFQICNILFNISWNRFMNLISKLEIKDRF